jgi:SAM-dependent methyltransferase
MDDPNYEAKVSFEIARYASSDIREVPPIYDYWMDTYVRPKLNHVLEVDTVRDFYVDHILQKGRGGDAPSPLRIVSLGAGDAELEVDIAAELQSRGCKSFSLQCVEISPALIERANHRIQKAGLGACMTVVQSDLNSTGPIWSQERCVAVLANHIIHHVVDLEGLFTEIARAIGDTGVFLTTEMIGRNGHRRWPESLSLVNALWETLPEELQYNHVWCKLDDVFDDYDCLVAGGFEGIRAQDILPLLLERFAFEKFLGFGCLPEAFLGKTYGPNFRPELLAHRQFVEKIDNLNSSLLELGVVKPTMMFAVLSNRNGLHGRFWRNLSPEFCVRNPQSASTPWRPQKSTLLTKADEFADIGFGAGNSGAAMLRSGWGTPEDWGTWMVGDVAVLELQVAQGMAGRGIVNLTMQATAFLPKRLPARSFRFLIDDREVGRVTFWKTDDFSKSFTFIAGVSHDGRVALRIVALEEASPAEDGSNDGRSLGLGLIGAIVQPMG